VENRFLFLPKPLVEQVADRCHMGKITRANATLFVFSRYNETGTLESFVISRGRELKWRFEDLWELSRAVPQLSVRGNPPPVVDGKFLQFYQGRGSIRYRAGLRTFLDGLGVPAIPGLT